MSAVSQLAPDTAIALGIASTAMPFARTREDQVERWLRALRMQGEVGTALRALGVAEGPLEMDGRRETISEGTSHEPLTGPVDRDPVALVTEAAVHIAVEREASGVATTDLMLAVMRVYGADFDRVLHAHGASRDELIERLGAGV
ncbi:MAG TPA: hypothetical protein VIG42_04090 [Solirubrobacteraceae bacterium]|jgi:hypothetical protein